MREPPGHAGRSAAALTRKRTSQRGLALCKGLARRNPAGLFFPKRTKRDSYLALRPWVTQGLDTRELVDLEDGLLAGEGDVLPAAGLSFQRSAR